MGAQGVVALVCARGGSKGVPGKNVRTLGGKPLIVHAIEQSLAIERVSRVIVSTESREIADVATAAGADVPFIRPDHLAADDSPEWDVWQHALAYLRATEGSLPKALLVCPTTSPLRSVSDLERCLDVFERGAADIVVTATSAHRNPYFNMVRENPDGSVGLVMEPEGAMSRRQEAPEVFDMTTVAYVARPSFVLAAQGLFDGRVEMVQIPPERALDIDTPLDFEIAEYLMSTKD